jgi:hypothetical protein
MKMANSSCALSQTETVPSLANTRSLWSAPEPKVHRRGPIWMRPMWSSRKSH